MESTNRVLHYSSCVVDAHTDIHLEVLRRRAHGEHRVLERVYVPRWRAGGVDVAVLSTTPKFGSEIYPYRTSPTENYLQMVDAIYQELSESPRCLQLVITPDDVDRARRSGRIGLILGLEGAEAIGTDLALLRTYHRLGMRVMTLSWHQRNLVADGVAEPSNAGLSNFGREVIREMNRLGVLIDVSHLSPRGIDDVVAMTSRPIVASHSNARAVHDHQRNLLDEHIMAIASTGGIIGIVFLGRFVAPGTPTLENVLDHIDYICGLVGVSHVALGPDYVDAAEDMIIDARRIAGPDQPIHERHITYAKGVETMEQMPRLTEGLAGRGYSDDDIRSILGLNYLRVFRAVVSSAEER